jgi:hypothetical protein
MMRTNTSFALLVLLSGAAARAQDRCPPLTVRVDNDVPGSGYSEERPENWESRNVNPCAQTYRYLSHTVGDGSRIGRAIWRPNIAADGWYAVEISYRATENRSDNVRYLLHDDLGGRREHFENQAHGGDCTRVDVGEIFCRAGGECRVVLDGNDGQSPAADETVFRRTRCDAGEPPPPGPCDGIRAQAAFEVCAETPTTCAGVFTNGAGCVAYCAAAGMTCRARFGGEPGCMQEPNAPLDCAADNGHASDWCECEAPPAPPPPPPPPLDAGAPPTSPPLDAFVPPVGPPPDAAGVVPADAQGVASADTGGLGLDAATADDSDARRATPDALAPPNRGILIGDDAGGSDAESQKYDAPGCAVGGITARPAGPWAALLALGGLLRARRGARSRSRDSRR